MLSRTPSHMPESSRIREEIRELLLSSTGHRRRLTILDSLKEKPEITTSLLPLVFSNLQSKDPELQDMAFGLAEYLENQGYTLAPICTDLATHLSSPRKDIRERVTKMIIKMGPDGKQAEDFALGCLRNRDREITISGLKILISIGNALSRGINQRVSSVTEFYPKDKEIRDLAHQVLQIIERLGERMPDLISNLPQQPCLLVDPDKLFRDQFAQSLRKSGLSTLGCATAEEAISLIEGGSHFSAIISEVKLGKISGLQFGQWIEQKFPAQSMPFIIFSTISNRQIISAAKENGAVEYILKGTPLQTTIKMIHHTLSRKIL